MNFSFWECIVGAAFLLHAVSVPSVIGFLWLGVFLWWGSAWTRPAYPWKQRYAFWLTTAFMAVVHFVVQLSLQISYLHEPSGHDRKSEWLSILGFPDRPFLQKLQVLLPAALCCSVSVVQATGLLLPKEPPVVMPPHNPLATLRAPPSVGFFCAIVASTVTGAGTLVVIAMITLCASWPTPLNVVWGFILLRLIWQWAHPRGSWDAQGPSSKPPWPRGPIFRPRLIRFLKIWTPVHMAVLYVFQIPLLYPLATGPFRWLNVGVVGHLGGALPNVLFAVHALALPAMFLLLGALYWAGNPSVRLWPPEQLFVYETEALVAQRASARSMAGSASPPGARTTPLGPGGPPLDDIGISPVAEDAIAPYSGLGMHGMEEGQSDGWPVPNGMEQQAHGAVLGAPEHAWGAEEDATQPLLQQTGTPAVGQPSTVRPPLVAVLSGCFIHFTLTLFAHPLAVACALTVFAMLYPCGLNLCVLCLALRELLLTPHPNGTAVSAYSSPILASLMVWFGLQYLLTALGLTDQVPWVLQTVMLLATEQLQVPHALQPALATVAFLGAIMATAAHRRRSTAPTTRSRIASLLHNRGSQAISRLRGLHTRRPSRRIPVSVLEVPTLQSFRMHQTHVSAPPVLPQFTASGGSTQVVATTDPGPSGLATAESAPAPSMRATSNATSQLFPRDQDGTHSGSGASGSSIHLLVLEWARVVLHAVGCVVVPFAWFALGAVYISFTWFGFGYAVGPMLLAAASLMPASATVPRVPFFSQHSHMRTFSTVHVVLVYAVCTLAPGSAVQQLVAGHAGALFRNVLPALVGLLLATAHSALGQWLLQRSGSEQGYLQLQPPGVAEGAGCPEGALRARQADSRGPAVMDPGPNGGHEELSARAALVPEDDVQVPLTEGLPDVHKQSDVAASIAQVCSATARVIVDFMSQIGLQLVGLLVLVLATTCFPVSLVGAAYILLGLVTLLLPSCSANCGSTRNGRARVWQHHPLPAVLLALLCVGHTVVQYTLLGRFWVPASSTCDVLTQLVGLDCGLHETRSQRLLVLLRTTLPQLVIVLVLAVRRKLWLLGKSLEPRPEASEHQGCANLQRAAAPAILVQRLVVRHANKLVLAAAVTLALLQPCVVGACVVAGAVVCTGAFGGPWGALMPAGNWGRGLALGVGGLVSLLWATLQYLACVQGVQAWMVGATGGRAVLEFWGIRTPQESGPMERSLLVLLSQKAIFLLAVAIKQQADGWRAALPTPLLSAAPPGAPCVLFWPPPGTQLEVAAQVEPRWGPVAMVQAAVASLLEFWRAMILLCADLLGFRAVPRQSNEQVAHTYEDQDITRHISRRVFSGLLLYIHSTVRSLTDALHVVLASAKWFTEDFTRLCGYEAALFAMVLLSVLSLNALALLYMAYVACGMRLAMTRALYLPRSTLTVLGVLTVLQYCLLLPWPAQWVGGEGAGAAGEGLGQAGVRGTEFRRSGADSLEPWAWLGLCPTETTVAVLASAFALVCMQRHSQAWQAACTPLEGHEPLDVSVEADEACGAHGSQHASDWRQQQLLATLLRNEQTTPAAHHQLYFQLRALGRGELTKVELGNGLAGQEAGVSSAGAAPGAGPDAVLRPAVDWGMNMTVENRDLWCWASWFKFWIFRLSLDTLMVFIFALCCIQRDLVHAGYLGLTLVLFRRREALRLQRNRLFFWIPLTNLLTIFGLLLFQFPLPFTRASGPGGDRHSSDVAAAGGLGARMREDVEDGEVEATTCSFALMLGLHQVENAGNWAALKLGPHGAGVPLLMWLAIQVQARLLEERGFEDTVVLLQASQGELRRHVLARQATALKYGMRQCLQLCRARAARSRRIARLKRKLDHSRGFFGADPASMTGATIASPRASGEPSSRSITGGGPSSTRHQSRRSLTTTHALLHPTEFSPPDQASQQGDEPVSDEGTGAGAGGTAGGSVAGAPGASPGLGAAGAAVPPRPDVVLPSVRLARGIQTGAGLGASMEDLKSAMQSPSQASSVHGAFGLFVSSELQHGSRLMEFLATTGTTLIHYAVHVHFLCCLVFILDFSIAAAVYALGSLLVALVTVPPMWFWQALLIYTEVLLLLQYVYQAAAQVDCVDVGPSGQSTHSLLSQLGLHKDVVHSVPLYSVYLVLLMHNYFLGLVAPQPPPALRFRVNRLFSNPLSMVGATPHNSAPWHALESLQAWVLAVLVSIGRYLWALCSETSDPPHCVLIHVKELQPGALSSPERHHALCQTLNAGLAALSNTDVLMAAMERAQSRPLAEVWRFLAAEHPSVVHMLWLSQEQLASLARSRELVDFAMVAPLTLRLFDTVHDLRPDCTSILFEVQPAPAKLQHAWQLDACPWWLKAPAKRGCVPAKPVSQLPARDAAAAITRLQQLAQLAGGSVTPAAVADGGGGGGGVDGRGSPGSTADGSQAGFASSSPGPWVASAPPSAAISRRNSFQGRVGAGSQSGGSRAAASTLTRASSQAGLPGPSSRTGQRSPMLVPDLALGGRISASAPSPRTGELGGSDTPRMDWTPGLAAEDQHESSDVSSRFLEILGGRWLNDTIQIAGDIEWRSRTGKDWYTLTLTLNAAAFLFFAVKCGRLVSKVDGEGTDSAGSHSIPASFLVALVVIFFNIALDRLSYSLGSDVCKALLLLAEVPLYFVTSWLLYWSPSTAAEDRQSLQIFMALRLAGMALSAVQVKSGYPRMREAVGDGLGQSRHSFYFYRHVDVFHWVAYQMFRSVPFLYELKVLLDWSVTRTTLTLVDWLKLEDIRASLYNRQCDLAVREATHSAGNAQPQLQKLLAGMLVFFCTLGLLWTPLFLFSSSNPTFQIPQIIDFDFNGTLYYCDPNPLADVSEAVVKLPVFSSSMQFSITPWPQLNASDQLPQSLAGYSREQLQVLCGGQDSDRAWASPAPLRIGFREALQAEAGRGADSPTNVRLELGFSAMRNRPPPTRYGGPLCEHSSTVQLSGRSVGALAAVMRGEQDWAPLEGWPAVPKASDGRGGDGKGQSGCAADDAAGGPIRSGLIGWVWQLKDHLCNVEPARTLADHEAFPTGDNNGLKGWPKFQLGCELGIQRDRSRQHEWWRMRCRSLNASDVPLAGPPASDHESNESALQRAIGEAVHVQCPPGPLAKHSGESADAAGTLGSSSKDSSDYGWGPPSIVAIVERVQSGFIGETISSFGITGLYFTLLYGVGRFLRMSLTNLRMRIPYEDLPNVEHLTTLCNDIAVAREERELLLEEQLFYSLINIYRSPNVLFELTKKDQ